MIYIGNQTSCWTASPAQPFEFALSQGFNAFEWFPDKKPMAGWDESDLDVTTRQKIKAEARMVEMRLSVHARYLANPMEPQGQEWLARDLALATDLGAVVLNIHLFEGQGLRAFINAIIPLIHETSRAGLFLSIENTPHHSPEQFNELFDRLSALPELDTANVGMCLDVGHANLSTATRNDYLGFVNRLKPTVPIIHLHAHENWGDADSHLPLFTGPAARDDSGIRALLEQLKARGFGGSIILEQWPNPPSLLTDARSRLLTLWGAEQTRGSSKPKVERTARSIAETSRGDDKFTQELVTGNREARSWREKLELIARVLASRPNGLSLEQLVEVSIYLRFLSTGEIACVEDGRHFRPAHHARLASDIFERLARLANEQNRSVLRRIYPALPSFDASFRQPEPLTRIRDIAHRNDISSELKREIKTILQNKLHRCAGPEDLVTSAALLKRFTVPGSQYPQEFVEQFKIFHAELSEFFNATSLEQRLDVLARRWAELKPLIETFLFEKRVNDLNGRLNALNALTELRRAIQKVGTPGTSPEAQLLVLADIGLDAYAFVILSQIINDGGKLEESSVFSSAGKALVWGLENLELSGVEPGESLALKSELSCWCELSRHMSPQEVLRYRGSLLRARRMAGDYGARFIALFAERSEKLGNLLGIAKSAVTIYCEAEIRSHLIFPISNLADALLNQTRINLGFAAWDTVAPGSARGTVVLMARLTQNQYQRSGPIVALVKTTEGDEEIPPNVVGIALAHEIPHLAHLSVRARQAGVVLVTCENRVEFDRLAKFAGDSLLLSATADEVRWETQSVPRSLTQKAPSALAKLGPVRFENSRDWLTMEAVNNENGGAKATGARRIAELASKGSPGFSTPRGLVLPFGVMEKALAAAPAVARAYSDLVRRAENSDAANRASVLRGLSDLVHQLVVPVEIQRQLQQSFGNDQALVVRSSANCEDLERFAGAGLYESVINVMPAQIESAVRAVWASLWTDRATASRLAAGISHTDAHMAVLIQELIKPDFSFVIHTVNPVSLQSNELYAEIVVGLGETLVSAADAGSPYRLRCDKNTGALEILAFGNLSQARRPAPGGGISRETLDYSQVVLSRQPAELEELGRRLARVGVFVEKAFGAPQDVEGVVANGQIFLVQSRAQQGLSAD